MSPQLVLDALWRVLQGNPAALDAVQLIGTEPALPSSFAVGTAAQASIAAAALAARELGVLRGGPAQRVSVDMRHAAVEFRSERYLRIDGQAPADPWDKIAGIYRSGDGGWVRLHTNFPHHRDGVLQLLGCAYERDAVAQALMRWNAVDFEAAAADAGMCVAALRSFDEWDAHPQGRAVAALPVLSVTRLAEGDAPARAWPPLPPGARPLHGLRVLDLTRVIAGPVAGRTLAAHGADVMLVTGPHLPSIPALVVDTGAGKRSAQLDLREAAGREALKALAREADVFLQGYRPGGLASLGFSPEALAALKPGIVCATLSAYGPAGPWAGRRGFDSLVQTASGFNVAEAEAAGGEPGAGPSQAGFEPSRRGADVPGGRARIPQPKVLPAQALDHASGYLLAFGIQRALARRAVEGGSWHVQVSLAQAGHWLRGLGRVPQGLASPEPAPDEIRALLDTRDSAFGRLHTVRHAGRLSETPPCWDRPPAPLGSDPAAWG